MVMCFCNCSYNNFNDSELTIKELIILTKFVVNIYFIIEIILTTNIIFVLYNKIKKIFSYEKNNTINHYIFIDFL
jgi:hypothetical protein